MDTSKAARISTPSVGIGGDFLDYADSLLDVAPPDPLTPSPIALRKRSPIAAKRRARFAKYVATAIGLAIGLCAAAGVKVAVTRGHDTVKENADVTSAPR